MMATHNKHQEKEKTDDSSLQKGKQPGEQSKPDSERVKTITPDNENGDPGAPSQPDSSNKGKGSSGENL